MTNVNMDIDQPPWVRVIWNPSTQKIITKNTDRQLLVSIISYSLGLKVKSKIRDLKQKYRELVEDPKASLLPIIQWSGNINLFFDAVEKNEFEEN